MPKPYSRDLRNKIIEAYQNGEGSMRQLGKRFKVSVTFIFSLLKRLSKTGSIDPKPHGGGRSPGVKAEGQTFLKQLVEKQPDLTLEEIATEYQKDFKPVSTSTIDRTLNKLKLTRKKKSLFEPRKNTPENLKKQHNYQINIASFDAEDFIFLDETGSVRNLTRSHARSPQGQRIKSPNSLIRGSRISTIGALGTEGILTALCYEGTLNSNLFEYFIEDFLVPVLTPSKVVILDNASSHHSEKAIAMIETTGAGVIFLPPYSPELNPIELIWSQVKNFLKKTIISSTEELYEAIAAALETITPQKARNCINHCLQ
jgi:transposase